MAKRSRRNVSKQSGFALLSSLILLFVLSAVAVSIFYSTTSESSNSRTDMQKNTAFYGAEAAMEKMTADLGTLYAINRAPNLAAINNLTNPAFQPNVPGVFYPEYSINVPNIGGVPNSVSRNISSGPNAGLFAQIINMQLSATAQTAGAASANGSITGNEQIRMTRNIEVALIPVFQFGIFSQTNLDFFNGPPFGFGGRVFTNANLFLATGNGLRFTSKVQAVGQVVNDELANGVNATGNWAGPVEIPTAPNACPLPVTQPAPPACRTLGQGANAPPDEGSMTQFFGAAILNPNWANISTVTYGGMLQNGVTGVAPLNLPFVNAAPGVPPPNPYEIIRRPPNAENPVTPLGSSRLYNQAQIRILLDDVQANLPGGPKPGDINLATYTTPGGPAPLVAPPGAATPVLGPAATAGPQSIAQGVEFQGCKDGKGNPILCAGWDPAWVNPNPKSYGLANIWPLNSGWLRVEYRNAAGNYIPVTQEWLNLGFARQAQQGGPTPNSELNITNTIHPNAILLLQYPAVNPQSPPRFAPAAPQVGWYPINMYDPREGETRDNNPALPFVGNASCAVGGVMNVIEIDMENLRRWLLGNIGVSGPAVENVTQNGYVVYFSDRRGMQLAPGAVELNGEYGFEDVINIGNADGAPNGVLDLGEDVNSNLTLDVYGTATIGNGFGIPAANANPYTAAGRMPSCDPTARVNRVTGPRHVFRAVNGSLGHVPVITGAPAACPGGTTIASENPVYVLGNYNANAALNFGNLGPNGVPEASSAVIADAVTLLSGSYTDLRGLQNPTNLPARGASTSFYRMAIAAGKNINFPAPVAFAPSSGDFGTDGGVHNFLRYIEAWGGQTLNYQGSLVSFYFSRQAVGVFKCCNIVYNPPTRNYNFDLNFQSPCRMPPGTPTFQTIDNLGYKQDLSPQ